MYMYNLGKSKFCRNFGIKITFNLVLAKTNFAEM